MSSVVITPSKLEGTITVPSSKSDAHRAIICASLAKGISEISINSISSDIMATIRAVQALGARVNHVGNKLLIDGSMTLKEKWAEIDCGESASTLRFLLPVACAGGVQVIFKAGKSLLTRPMGVFKDCFKNSDISIQEINGFPARVEGKLAPGKFYVRGDISSQFITGLLLALPLLDGDSEIYLNSPLESEPYVEMTINTLNMYGVNIIKTPCGYKVPGRQVYKPRIYKVEGDWSQAAFFMVGGAINGCVRLRGLSRKSRQGDFRILKLLESFGAKIQYEDGDIIVSKGDLKGRDINVSHTPDIVPILAVLASMSKGFSNVFGASRLRFKESDRLRAITENLHRMGVEIMQTGEGFLINGKSCFNGGALNGFNDHRIVMAFSIAASCASNKVSISGAESVCKSYPEFFEHYSELGGIINVVDF